ncbi:uncharacterized protein LOC124700459 [Lolium rigidum]|uniref:uncharacterized protein LOC124700459 n=1 Tax=Lolium rigidum TaxID=89674 RepID=UPI001F5CC4EB|nr:uncharacterized protein LOC124700459 [Lolium rigidum]
MAATMKLSLTFILLLSSGLVAVLGDGGDCGPTCETIRCIQGGNITCANRPGEVIQGCHCLCAPKNGRGCVLHLQSGTNENCPRRTC